MCHKFVAALLVVVLSSIWLPTARATTRDYHTLQAEVGAESGAYGLQCKKKICAFTFKETSVNVPAELLGTGIGTFLEIVQENLKVLPGGKKFALSKGLKLQTPFGKFNLANADLFLTLNSENNIDTFTGKTQIAFPSFGLFRANALVTAEVGYTTGKLLPLSQAPVKPEAHYLLLNFDSNFRITAEVVDEETKISEIEFTIPKGRKLTVIIDPAGEFIYVDGMLTLTNIGQLLILNRLVESKLRLPFFFARDLSTVHISGLIAEQEGMSYLQIEGGYEFSENLVSSWLGSHASVLAVEGKLRIDGDGLLLQGQSRSKILPDKLLRGFLQVETYIPFEDLAKVNTQVTTGASVPALNAAISGTYSLDLSSLNFVKDSNLYQQISHPTNTVYLFAKDSFTGVGLFALRGYQSIHETTYRGYDWAVENAVSSTDAAKRLAQSGIHSARELALDSYDWSSSFIVQTTTGMIDGILSGYEATTEAATNAYDTVSTAAANVTNGVTETLQSGYETVQNGASQGYASLADNMSGTVNTITNTVQSGMETVEDKASGILSDTVGTVQSWCSWVGVCSNSEDEADP